MKHLIILVAVFIVSLAFSLFIFLDQPKQTAGNGISWLYKSKEIESRLLSIPIILYHNIDGKGPFSINMDNIQNQFRIIKENGIRVIPLLELVRRLENPRSFNDRVLVITFDDGFMSMYTKLLPLAKEFEYPITLFVYTDNIKKRANTSLTWEKLKILDDAGIKVESHSISHADLTALSKKGDMGSRKKLFDELYVSKRIIELYLEKEVTMFAFPYGRYDLALVELCTFAGYRRVFSTDYGSNVVTRDNYCLKRHHIKRNFGMDYFNRLIE